MTIFSYQKLWRGVVASATLLVVYSSFIASKYVGVLLSPFSGGFSRWLALLLMMSFGIVLLIKLKKKLENYYEIFKKS